MASPLRDFEPSDYAQLRQDPAARRTIEVVEIIFGTAGERPFDVKLWNGLELPGSAPVKADFSLQLQRRGALRRMLVRPSELSIVEAYISGDIEIVGNLESAMSLGDSIGKRIKSIGAFASLYPKVLALPVDDDPGVEAAQYQRAPRVVKSRERKSEAAEIEFHYGVGNEFYALWLDPRMQYTCAYYRSAEDDLATAQTQKLEHICRKLRLRPGERLLDIGCGWGGLVQYAAKHHGVHALGITLSEAQARWGQESIARNGLSDRCEVRAVDFRDLPKSELFDKMTSVGVTEHIPEDAQPAYFARAYEALRPGGLFMNHCEVSNLHARRTFSFAERFERWLWKRDQFIDKYVFPDAKLINLGSIITSAEKCGFETRDIESLREHYTLTLRAWLAGLRSNEERAMSLVGERTYRVWNLYMSAAAASFDSGAIGLAQILLSKPTKEGKSNLPWTREDIYRQ